MTLQEFFVKHNRIALGFSGGVDSTYLLYEGIENKANIKPYFIKTQFQPNFELKEAKEFCKKLGIELTIIEHNIFQHNDVIVNPENRCYFCKRHLFSLIQEKALSDGYSVIIDGTNASDDSEDRPGMKVLEEMKVLSPLRLCGLGKDKIREESKKANLPTWNKPSYACLATRIPSGTMIRQEDLASVEKAEDTLFELGFSDFRVRYFHGAARIQMPQSQFEKACSEKEIIRKKLSSFFDIILLDLKCR
ncbi:MAG: ATP-dependent sacrificial sulfur transferase LarE [Treponemataceae bacterium]